MSFRKVRTLEEIKRLVAENTEAKEALRSGISESAYGKVAEVSKIQQQLAPITKLLQAVPGVSAKPLTPAEVLGEPKAKSVAWFFDSLNQQLTDQGVKSDASAKILQEIADKSTSTRDLIETTNETLRENGATAQDLIRFQTLLYQEDPRIADLIVKYNQEEIDELELALNRESIEREKLKEELLFIKGNPQRVEELEDKIKEYDAKLEKTSKIISWKSDEIEKMRGYSLEKQKNDTVIDKNEQQVFILREDIDELEEQRNIYIDTIKRIDFLESEIDKLEEDNKRSSLDPLKRIQNDIEIDYLDKELFKYPVIEELEKNISQIDKDIESRNENIDKVLNNITALEQESANLLTKFSILEDLENETDILKQEQANLEFDLLKMNQTYLKTNDKKFKDKLEADGQKIQDRIDEIDELIEYYQSDIEKLKNPKTPKEKEIKKKKRKGKSKVSQPQNIELVEEKPQSLPGLFDPKVKLPDIKNLIESGNLPNIRTQTYEEAQQSIKDISDKITAIGEITGKKASDTYKRYRNEIFALFGYTTQERNKFLNDNPNFSSPKQVGEISNYKGALSSVLNELGRLEALKEKPVSGVGLKIGGQIDPRRLQLNKYSPYKIANDILGALNIDANKLINHRRLTAQHVGTGEYLFKDKKASDDLIRLLTRRYDGRIPYSPQAVADFGKLIKGSGLPMKRTNKKVQLILGPIKTIKSTSHRPEIDDSSDDDAPIIIFSSPEEMAKRFEVLRASIGAGNSSKRARNEMAGILDKLFNLGFINKKEMKRLSQQSGIYR